ncbi:MAG: hypothetical protein IPO33_00005 [Saprospiraceae bacterium]|nr:hypothetical protein [Candidatus Brachybacter algidus]
MEYEENGVKIYHKIVNLNTGEVSPFPYPENTNLTYVSPFSEDNDKIPYHSQWMDQCFNLFMTIAETFIPEKNRWFRRIQLSIC